MVTFDVSEDLGHGIVRHWTLDNRIAIYDIGSTTRAGADTWAKAVLHDVEHWRPDSPYLICHNFLKVAVTPYNRRVAEDVCRSYKRDVTGRVASVIKRGPIGFAFHLYTERILSRMMPETLKPGFHYDLKNAIDWLKELLPDG